MPGLSSKRSGGLKPLLPCSELIGHSCDHCGKPWRRKTTFLRSYSLMIRVSEIIGRIFALGNHIILRVIDEQTALVFYPTMHVVQLGLVPRSGTLTNQRTATRNQCCLLTFQGGCEMVLVYLTTLWVCSLFMFVINVKVFSI